jgi:biotin carboxyl carrier protein
LLGEIYNYNDYNDRNRQVVSPCDGIVLTITEEEQEVQKGDLIAEIKL